MNLIYYKKTSKKKQDKLNTEKLEKNKTINNFYL